MINEDYVSYEIAKLLKEKGFDEKVNTHYLVYPSGFSEFFDKKDEFPDPKDVWLKCPTHQMAMAWLRKEKNIIINVWYNGVDWDVEYYNNEDENFYLITDSSCNSYEEAVEAALKYCLENLI